jgi:1-acyl-sn-glycerol-3-phosphate acyltransferase
VGGSAARRRTISVATLLLALLVVTLTAPLLVAAATVADLVTRRRGRPHLRLLALAVLVLVIELVGLLGAAATWVLFAGGRFFHTRLAQRLHFGLQRWWTGALLTAAARTVDLHVQVDDPGPAARGNAIVIGRHTSIGDAAIPAVLLGNLLGLDVRYVLKRQLQWSPCIDLVGHRLPHHFVERDSGDNRGELAAIHAIGAGLDDHTSVVIFPEGTFFTPARHERAVARLRAGTRPELAERAAQLRHLLPPRPAGTLTLLDAAPDADVVVLGHVGFEQFSSLEAIRRAVPFRAPVQLWVWRVPRAEVPIGNDARVAWLYDQWTRLDTSIAQRLADRS